MSYKCRKCGHTGFYITQPVRGRAVIKLDEHGNRDYSDLHENIDYGKESSIRCGYCDSLQKKMTKDLKEE